MRCSTTRGGAGGGGGRGDWGGKDNLEFWYGCASQYFKTYPIHILLVEIMTLLRLVNIGLMY